MNAAETIDTEDLARRIRTHALQMTNIGGAAHIGAIFSCADILAVLYGGILNVDPKEPRDPDRDRFVLSKGHAGGGLYAALAERGFFSAEKLRTHYQNGSDLSGHVSHKLPGIEVSTGALGHGLSIAGSGDSIRRRRGKRKAKDNAEARRVPRSAEKLGFCGVGRPRTKSYHTEAKNAGKMPALPTTGGRGAGSWGQAWR